MITEKKEGFTGHPAKLRNGAWGAHVNDDKVMAGATVRLTTKAGKDWDAVIEKVVWTGVDSDGVPCALCSLVGKTPPDAANTPAPPATTPTADGQSADF